MSAEDDRTLDAALSALAGVDATAEDDDARWAKRVASRVSTFAPASRRELDTVLEAPFPDGHKDRENIGPSASHDDDHTAAALASDSSGAHGWEGSMSDDDSSRPPNSLSALSGLTRSGPTSKNPDSFDGAAKGDDSGLINLAAMNKTDEPPPVEEAPAVAAANEVAPPSGKVPPPPISSKKIAIASTASANAPASSTAAAAAPAKTAAAAKKGSGIVVWLGLAGVAAAAAVAFVMVGPMARKSEDTAAPAAAPPAASEAKKAKPADEKVAAAEPAPPMASATAAPEGNTDQGTTNGMGAQKPMAPTPGSKSGAYDPTPKMGVSPTPTATGTTPAPAAKPSGDPKGGSLDDVLGIGKDQPAAKKPETDNLPDKPESMDVRSAINAKVSSASACVKGLDGPSSVAVTFGPSGAVSGVVVTSGPAKGTGAESCIKNAFNSAKVTASKKGATGSATLVP